jgi:hypothetical protein
MMRWARHIARIGRRRGMRIRYWWESRKVQEHYGGEDVGDIIILRQILKTWCWVI